MAREYDYRRDDSRLFVALRDNGHRFKIIMRDGKIPVIDEKDEDIQLVRTEESHMCFEYRERRFHCVVTNRNKNSYTMLINGVEYTFSVESVSSYLRKKILAKDTGDESELSIKAPMPGKITAVYVDPGDEVNAGDPLFALEAMKMQNEILSPIKGKILELNIKEEDVVVKNDELVKIGVVE
ncbi:MAG: hypothetical protein C0592_11980 [Marinilabiliales bacterium]|nr:MAG: hypothetical protein C0592_11980 [Marinilabiliales bacterium]